MGETALVKVGNYFQNDLVRARFREIMGGSASAYISSVLLAVSDSEALQKCNVQSIYSAALRAATLRLSVDPSIGQAYLVPFQDKAVLVVGYKGLHDMAVRTGKYRYINVAPIYNGECADEDRMTGFHKITGQRIDNTVIGWIAGFEMYSGYGHTMYMTVDEIHDHAKKYSKSYNSPKGRWTTDTAKMERKTVLRLLLRRWGYLDPSDAAALAETEAESSVIEGEYIGSSQEHAPRLKQTEAEIMNDLGFGDNQQTEKEQETKPDQQPDFDPVKCLVENCLASNEYAAKGLLDRYVPEQFKTDSEKLLCWVRIYRGWRETLATPEVSADHATKGEIA